MGTDTEISRDGVVKPVEIEELRLAVGWDKAEGTYARILGKHYTYYTIRTLDSRLVGYMSILSDGIADAFLLDLMIHPDYQRKGLGTQLLRQAIRDVQEAGIRCIQVTFDERLEKFYSHCGFHIFRGGVIDFRSNPGAGVENEGAYPQPREIVRKGNHPYKFRIYRDFTYCHTGWSLDKPFVSKWLKISKNGKITVKANESGYAWDGCTPKWSLLNLVILGTPDGHVNHRTMKPYTYYASLVHDALYQYLDTVPISKREIDLLFLKMLDDFKLRRLYYMAVRLFGGRGVKQNGLPRR